ncbi:MAG TPA: DNA gyrase subunit A, partial [Candidatus Thermoplasmatota archaeon]|nr:DNA gyrase subunit A [Candidatus Thermoplasmatota archaeon]
MRQSFLDYAMSVIVSRALPDARDGLKPVHRRILYAMSELGMGPTSAYKKSARVVGEVLGKYHPHGDSAVYEAMVRMAQPWSLRYPLVDGQGNFGSIDGDGPAAMRYTEARLAKIATPVLADLDKETVEFTPNFDATLQEPVVLPCAFPNLLVSGSSGIAVGMATNVPPHNLREIVDAAVRLIDQPDATALDLLETVKGPDFPTGGVIHGRSGILGYLTTGRGRVVVRARTALETSGDRERIIVSEIPYQVQKGPLLEQIAELAKEKVIEGIADLRDESDRRGMRMVIDLKRDAIPDVVLNQLWKHTSLQSTFAVQNLALVDGRPRTMGVKELLDVFLRHRFVMVTRRTRFELRKAEERAHILEGLLAALFHIDAVVALIRASKDPEEAQKGLMANFRLTEVQAKAILDMKLQRLTNLESKALKDEHAELTKVIAHLKKVLADDKEVNAIIRTELQKAREEFGDDRRTEIVEGETDIDDESLIPEEPSVYLFTQHGYLKRLPLDTWRQQHRGGRGLRGMTTKEEDQVVETAVGSSHDWLCLFTNHGRLHWLKGHKVPAGSRQAKGKPVVNLLQLEPNEVVETIIPVRDFEQPDRFLFFATKKGVAKRVELSAFKNVRATGIIAVDLRDGDELLAVRLTDGKQEIILATKQGQACRFDETEVRAMGRQAAGVRGIELEEGDEVVSLAVAEPGTSLVSVTANGFGKRTELQEYRKTHRGGKGVRTIVVNDRNGGVVAVRTVRGDEGLLLIATSGMGVRIPVDQLRAMGRSTQGVTLMRLDEGDQVTQVVVLPAEEAEALGSAGTGAPPGPPAPQAPTASPPAIPPT